MLGLQAVGLRVKGLKVEAFKGFKALGCPRSPRTPLSKPSPITSYITSAEVEKYCLPWAN